MSITFLPPSAVHRSSWAALALALMAFAGCGHARNASQSTPPEQLPPALTSRETARTTYDTPLPPVAKTQTARIPVTPVPPGGVSRDDLDFVLSHRPIFSEEGLATWYTAPYKGRKAANGQVFDDRALTAAHRTLPMGSLIVVTNLTTRQASAMRVTDRGPFVDGRIVDLTIASAKATGVYRSGLTRVRLDVYQTPKPVEWGGRWCVQIGGFSSEVKARRLKEQLLRKYPEAHVIEFPGEDKYWVRIRPDGDNREQAEAIATHLRPAEGEAFLTRLD